MSTTRNLLIAFLGYFSLLIFIFYLDSTGQISIKFYFSNNQAFSNKENSLTAKQSKCKTNQNLYTKSEIDTIFKYKQYDFCTTPTSDKISFENNTITAKCENSEPQFAVSIFKNEFYSGYRKYKPRWSKFKPSINNKEFAFIKCSEKSIYALVFNQFKKEAAQSANKIRNKLRGSEKQMSVLLLVFDSISRYSAQRNLPKVTKFLKSLEKSEDFSVYDMEKVAVPHARTRLNMAQILFGKSSEEIIEVVGKDYKKFSKSHVEYQKKNSIWSYYSGLGYVTMFLHDSVADDLMKIIGRAVKTDHLFSVFWRYLWGTFEWTETSNGQKCVGNRFALDYGLEYTYQFFNNYQENHKFAYVHLSAAHEATGYVKTIDLDLLNFLNNFLYLTIERGENLALFLISDHGFKEIKGAQWDYRSFYEYYTPMTYLILSKEIVRKMDAHENLKHNEGQLVSRYDINLSLKHLASFPYDIYIDKWYTDLKEFYTYNDTISLFEEKANVERTCEDFGVRKEFCLCEGFETVDEDGDEGIISKEILKLFVRYLNRTGEVDCDPFERIESVEVERFRMKTFEDGFDSLYRVEMKHLDGLKIKLEVNLCSVKRIAITNQILKGDEYPSANCKISEGMIFIQISNVYFSLACRKSFCGC